jgi:hypothetical protein
MTKLTMGRNHEYQRIGHQPHEKSLSSITDPRREGGISGTNPSIFFLLYRPYFFALMARRFVFRFFPVVTGLVQYPQSQPIVRHRQTAMDIDSQGLVADIPYPLCLQVSVAVYPRGILYRRIVPPCPDIRRIVASRCALIISCRSKLSFPSIR